MCELEGVLCARPSLLKFDQRPVALLKRKGKRYGSAAEQGHSISTRTTSLA